MKHTFRIIAVISSIVLLFSICGKCVYSAESVEKKNNDDIKLVLTIVVDQLRADMITRLEDRFCNNGFRYLIDNGTWYKEARLRHCTTLTSVGHATIYTGSTPADHGIIGNYWFDRQMVRESKRNNTPLKHRGCVESSHPDYPGSFINGPMQLTSTTIGDELVLATNRRSRVFSVSLKDRASILPGGYMGTAFWFSPKNGHFISSEYYYKDNQTPKWLKQWNDKKPADQYKDKTWTLLLKDPSKYVFGNADDREEEKTYIQNKKRSSIFPHHLGGFGNDYYSQLYKTPYGDRLTLEFVKHMVAAEKIGQGEYLDMLAVSFSCTDVIGHMYGVYSLEYEDNALQVDALLADLFQYVDKTVGLDKTLIMLTADHGGEMIPEVRERLHMPGGRVQAKKFKPLIDKALQKKFNITESVFVGFRNPSIYLDMDMISALGLNIAEVEAEVASVIGKVEGIAAAVTRSDLLAGRVKDSKRMDQLKIVFHAKRSGNVLLLQEPFYFLYHVYDKDASMHGAPYSYDNHVPLLWAGPGVEKQMIYRQVTPRDIAPTLAHILGIEAPSGCSGIPLVELLKK